MDDQRRRGGFGAALVLLAVIGFVAKFWVWILAIVGVILLGVLVGLLLHRASERDTARRRQQAAIAARADEQHKQILAGDDRGIYGIYPPDFWDGIRTTPPWVERRPRPGESWADYLAETRKQAIEREP